MEQEPKKLAWHLILPISLAGILAGLVLIPAYFAYQDLRELRNVTASHTQVISTHDKALTEIVNFLNQPAKPQPVPAPVTEPEKK